MERIRETSSCPRARMTGVVYLIYFLMAILAEFLVGRKRVAYGNATNLFAAGCYAVLTLLFYGMFKPVNRSPFFARGAVQPRGMRRDDSWLPSSRLLTHQPLLFSDSIAC